MPEPKSLTVVIPVYNEATTVRSAVDRLLATPLPLDLEAIVVDDGSTDGSADQLADLVSAGRIRLLRHDRNRGKGAGIRTALAAASGELFTILDADLEYDPHDYVPLLAPIRDGKANVVYGTRHQARAHFAFTAWHVLGNYIVTHAARVLFDRYLTDIETCFKLASTDQWRRLDLQSDGFGVEAEATAKWLRAGERIQEVPIAYQSRGRDEGKKLTSWDGLVTIWVLMRVRFGRR